MSEILSKTEWQLSQTFGEPAHTPPEHLGDLHATIEALAEALSYCRDNCSCLLLTDADAIYDALHEKGWIK